MAPESFPVCRRQPPWEQERPAAASRNSRLRQHYLLLYSMLSSAHCSSKHFHVPCSFDSCSTITRDPEREDLLSNDSRYSALHWWRPAHHGAFFSVRQSAAPPVQRSWDLYRVNAAFLLGHCQGLLHPLSFALLLMQDQTNPFHQCCALAACLA
jgi:hypothetical protein